VAEWTDDGHLVWQDDWMQHGNLMVEMEVEGRGKEHAWFLVERGQMVTDGDRWTVGGVKGHYDVVQVEEEEEER
jgi:hypothetical protein